MPAGTELATGAVAPTATSSASGEPSAGAQPPLRNRCRPAYVLTAKETRPLPAPLARPAAGRRQLRLHGNARLAPASPRPSPRAPPRWHRSVLGAGAPSCHRHPEGKHHGGFSPFAHGSALASSLPLCWLAGLPARRPAALPTARPRRRKGSLPPASRAVPSTRRHPGRQAPSMGSCGQTQHPGQGPPAPPGCQRGAGAPTLHHWPRRSPPGWSHLQGLVRTEGLGQQTSPPAPLQGQLPDGLPALWGSRNPGTGSPTALR